MNADHDMSELLPWYAAGGLSEEGRARVEAHLARCAICRDELTQWQAVGAMLTHAEARIPADKHAEAGWAALASRLDDRDTPMNAEEGAALRQDIATGQPIRWKGPTPMLTPRVSSIPRRPLAAIGVAVSLVLIVAIVGTFAALRGFQRHPLGPSKTPVATLPSDHWTLIHPGPTNTGLPLNAAIGGLVMVAPGDGWAVGASYDESAPTTSSDQGTRTLLSGLILCLHNGTWTVSPDSPNDVALSHLWMLSPTEGWASDVAYSQFYHFQSGHWLASQPPMPLPASPTTDPRGHYVVDQMYIRASNDMWLTGYYANTLTGTGQPISLWHYDGRVSTHIVDTSQSESPMPIFPIGPDEAYYFALSPTGSNVVDAGTRTIRLKHVLHGQVTSVLTTDPGNVLVNLYAAASNDVWVTAESHELPSKVTVYHFDGATWSRVSMGIPADVWRVVMTGSTEGWGLGYTLEEGPSHEPFGQALTALYHFKDGVWTRANLPSGYLFDLGRISATSLGEAWAVGESLIFWARGMPHEQGLTAPSGGLFSGTGFVRDVLLHYVNGKWVQYTGAS
ncbi:MAG TPA: zf-HC2 domain-containing protein [Ktedonobacterales bacterium]